MEPGDPILVVSGPYRGRKGTLHAKPAHPHLQVYEAIVNHSAVMLLQSEFEVITEVEHEVTTENA